MAAPLVIRNVTLVTGDREGTVLPDSTIVTDASGRISAVGAASAAAIPAGARIIDGTGRFAMPGMINAHAHLFSEGKPLPPILLSERAEKLVSIFMKSPVGRAYLRKRTRDAVVTQLKTGVTTIRSVGDPGYEGVEIAAAIDRGDLVGPRLLASGPLLAVTGGHGAPQIALISDNPWDARRNVRENIKRGVKAIKIAATGGVTDAKTIGQAGRPEMTEEEMTAICEEAHGAGILVAAHAQSAAGIAAALRAGVDTIEHGAAMNDEIIALFNDNPRALHGRSALIPTLQACLPLVRLGNEVTGINEVNKANAVMVLDEMLEGIRTAIEHDIALGMGTDSALTFVTHYNTWRELDLLVRVGGLSPARALHAATQSNAQILGLDTETGTIAAGLAADIVLTEANPLDDLRTLAAPFAVIARGTVVDDLSVIRFPEIDAKLDTI
ncbi:metal-dependent hydrolase family protein [Microbacterium stercoris]|uniref:Amidohydrolase family protein n=1 Tax=Microbacterium stercoris TaxID=2820289 RepID=A0A939QK05_9MICO|nr:amidohydrolase family protein [Microbacterium stercoris]MBO3662346.1 amidohydrolase family protein [Microbacterium stercoris]MBO3664338.1 amidohydrolase family protein [Microbacterium stercoris]